MTSMYRLNLMVQHVLEEDGHYALQDVKFQHGMEDYDYQGLQGVHVQQD